MQDKNQVLSQVQKMWKFLHFLVVLIHEWNNFVFSCKAFVNYSDDVLHRYNFYADVKHDLV